MGAGAVISQTMKILTMHEVDGCEMPCKVTQLENALDEQFEEKLK